MKIYVASSWRNDRQPEIIRTLRSNGYDVYDFRNPSFNDKGFHWFDIDPNWKNWTMGEYREYLEHPIVKDAYVLDTDAMRECDVFLGVMPFGRSASMEMGWAVGQCKTTILLLSDAEPELMVKMFDFICVGMDEVLKALDWYRKEV
jgi:hypothetical protein